MLYPRHYRDKGPTSCWSSEPALACNTRIAAEAPTAHGRTVADKLHQSFDIDFDIDILGFDIDFLGLGNSHNSRAGRGPVRSDSNNICNDNQLLDNNPAPAVGGICGVGAVGFGGCADSNFDLGELERSIPIFQRKKNIFTGSESYCWPLQLFWSAGWFWELGRERFKACWVIGAWAGRC